MVKEKDNRLDDIITYMGILFRIITATVIISIGWYLKPDSYTYMTPGINLANGMGFLSAYGTPDLNRTPVYPLVICGAYLLLKEHFYIGVIAFQIIVSIAVYLTMYRPLIKYYIKDEKLVRLANIIWAFDYFSIYYSCIVLTDSLFQQFIIATVFFMMKFWSTEKDRYLIFTGLTLGIASLLRPIAMFLCLALCIGVFGVYFLKKKYKEAIKKGVLLLIFAEVFILGWSARNYSYSGDFKLSLIQDINISQYNAAAVVADLEGVSYYEAFDERTIIAESLFTDLEAYQNFVDESRELLDAHKDILAKYYVMGVGLLNFYPGAMDVLANIDKFSEGVQGIKEILISDEVTNKLVAIFGLVFSDNKPFLVGLIFIAVDWIILMILTINSYIYIFRKDSRINWYEKWMVIGMWAYFVISSAMPVGYGSYPRFRVAYVPILIILAIRNIELIKHKDIE